MEPSKETGHVSVREMTEHIDLVEKKMLMKTESQEWRTERQRVDSDFLAVKSETFHNESDEKHQNAEPNDVGHKIKENTMINDHRIVEKTFSAEPNGGKSCSEERKEEQQTPMNFAQNVSDLLKNDAKSFHEEHQNAEKKSQAKKNTEKSVHEDAKEEKPPMNYAEVVSSQLKTVDQKKVGLKSKEGEKSKKKTEEPRIKEVKPPPKPEPEPLKDYNHRHEESDIEVTFEVLLSPEMASFGKNVFIIFGRPLSDWTFLMVQMKPKEGVPVVIEPGRFVYLTGTLPLNLMFKSKTIPYKYVVQNEHGYNIWEDIYAPDLKGGEVNRCLVVPDKVESKFTKYDDIILPKGVNNPLQLQRFGREVAIKWMLPRPKNFGDPNFDFDAIFERFSNVIKTFGSNGTKLCIDDSPKGCFNPSGFSIESAIKNQLRDLFKHFETSVNDSDPEKMLRVVIYLCLIDNSKYLEIVEQSQFLNIFEAFWRFKELFPNQLPKSIHGDIQSRICAALKKLVQSFVDLPFNR